MSFFSFEFKMTIRAAVLQSIVLNHVWFPFWTATSTSIYPGAIYGAECMGN